MVYGDEDRLDEHGHLTDPWLKPDWSPDTFLSTFYFGSIFAIRASELMLINPGERTAAAFEARASIAADSEEEKEAASAELDERMRSWIYGSLCLKIAQADGGFSRGRRRLFQKKRRKIPGRPYSGSPVSRVQKADPLGQQSDPRLPDRAFQRRIRFAAARQHYYSQQG